MERTTSTGSETAGRAGATTTGRSTEGRVVGTAAESGAADVRDSTATIAVPHRGSAVPATTATTG